jgi:hypothetical protein
VSCRPAGRHTGKNLGGDICCWGFQLARGALICFLLGFGVGRRLGARKVSIVGVDAAGLRLGLVWEQVRRRERREGHSGKEI